jgi:hypothetical protein
MIENQYREIDLDTAASRNGAMPFVYRRSSVALDDLPRPSREFDRGVRDGKSAERSEGKHVG